ncbi:MAG: hypothetical protein IKQ91_04955, partial [Oscillospiraceae bacterium]|nr:hypothetical protein [Oscillospiraceae bacterium]
ALERCINCMGSWLYGGDPMQNIVYREDFAAVRKMLAEKQFEDLLRGLLLEEDGIASLRTLPSYTRGEELRQEEAERLVVIRSGWTEADAAANMTLNENLQRWQQTPDTPEQLATLPVLPLSEVSDQPSWVETIEKQVEGVTVLYHPAACSGIVHLTLNFALTDCPIETLTALSHSGSLFGKLATAKHSALELQQVLKHTVGRLETGLDVAARKNETDVCTPLFTVRCSVLEEKLADAFALILEVLQTTDFTQKDKIREILVQTNERLRQMGVMAGHALGLTAVMSRYGAKQAVSCALSGYPFIKQTQQLVRDFDTEFEGFAEKLHDLQQNAFCRARLYYASVTAAKEVDISALLRGLPEGTPVPAKAAYALDLPERMGYPIPAQIGFAVQGYRLPEEQFGFDAGWRVAAKIISLSYLWNMVRVQGGAYGTGISLWRNGTVCTYSYRDPSPARSLEVNRGIADFIREFCESGEPLDGYIISTVNDDDPLRSPRELGTLADVIWCTGRTLTELTADRKQLLAVSRRTLLDSCRIWETFAENGAVCVCASENLLADCNDLMRKE